MELPSNFAFCAVISSQHSAPPAASASPDDPNDRRRLRILVRWLLVTAFLLVLIRVFVLEPYGIPTGSMRPTVIEGDVLLVNKLPYTIRSLRRLPFTGMPIPYITLPGLGRLERGDVVVFEYPSFAPRDSVSDLQYVKRCAAIAGDTVQLVDGRIRVNNVELPPPADPDDPDRRRRAPIARSRVAELLRDGNAVVVPFEGFRIEMDSAAASQWRPWIESEGVSVAYRNRIVFLAGLPATHYTFQRDYFFALGDNSSVSRDSRVFGFVPYDNLIGRAWLIYWSRDPDEGVRWDRIGTLVR